MDEHRRVGRRRFLGVAGAALAAATVAGCASLGGSADGGGGTATVEVGPDGEYVFRPGTDDPLRIEEGTTVTFVWRSDGHDLTVSTQPIDATWEGVDGFESTGYEHQHTFDVPGQYVFHCSIHLAQGMSGTILVE